jgi:hypothetical protein
MAVSYQTIIADYNVDSCPKCGEAHTYKLKVIQNEILIFGGGKDCTLITFVCPKTNQSFKKEIPNPPHGEIIGLASSSEIDYGRSASRIGESPLMDAEFFEWIRSSRSTAIDFCKTMIGISVGAIPVYFAVLKFLGFATTKQAQLGLWFVLPPLVYLIGLIAFVLALRPAFKSVSIDTFSEFRKTRLINLNRWVTCGTMFFVIATLCAFIIFSYVMIT